MEFKIRRFSELLSIFFVITSLIVVLDEVSTPRFLAFKSTNEHFETSFREQYRMNKAYDYALTLKKCEINVSTAFRSAADNQDSNSIRSIEKALIENQSDLKQFITVESNQNQYYNTTIGDTFWILYTPIYHRVHEAIEFRSEQGQVVNPEHRELKNRFTQVLGIALFMILLSMLSYKSTAFEWKVALLFFVIVLSVIQYWLI